MRRGSRKDVATIAKQLPRLAGSTSVALPATAIRPLLYLDDQSGRDQVARVAAQDWSAFERPLPALLHAWARRCSGLAIDVGANTGFYALLAALSAPKLRVLAFEPDAAALEVLRSNIGQNGLEARITVNTVALSDRRGSAPLYVPTQEHGLIETSSSLDAAFKEAHSEIRDVSVTTLDAALGHWHHRLRRVDLMKIDVEGHEAAVLRGTTRTVRRWRPVIFIEVLWRAEMAFLTRFITEHRYVDFPLTADSVPLPVNAVEFDPGAMNHAFVPIEHAAAFQACCAPRDDGTS